MKLCEIYSFISLNIFCTNTMCWKHAWHMDKCVDGWNANLWMNESHMDFTSNKSISQMCFQCMILMCEMCKLWLNEICTIFIIKSCYAKFAMYV
jgi:hypothetical protein